MQGFPGVNLGDVWTSISKAVSALGSHAQGFSPGMDSLCLQQVCRHQPLCEAEQRCEDPAMPS